MANKQSKKGKNLGSVDTWLDTLGYFRKNIAFDETCMFRAVAEQIFSCQMYHEKIRRECVDYAKNNYDQFLKFTPKETDLFEHLDKLSKHMAVCGSLEIQIISKLYQHEVIVFDGISNKVTNVTQSNYKNQLLLCKMSEDHYDSVYKREYIAIAGFCQSIVYNIVYENVLQISNVQDIVQSMLYDKHSNNIAHEECNTKTVSQDDLDISNSVDKNGINSKCDVEICQLLTPNWAPFPFKVAKALDPTIYRNIEYDSWTEMRKEMRLGEWYYGDNNLILGTRCNLKVNDTSLSCYLQEFLNENNKCIVYITGRAEKRIVDYKDLSPEDDAKPWPLPYRFCKTTFVPVPPEIKEKETNMCLPRKKRDKKRSIKNSSVPTLNIPTESSQNVSIYEGCPLKMQDSPKLSPIEDVPITEASNQTITETPQTCVWNVSQTTDQVVWQSNISPNVNAYPSPKIMMPSAPDSTFADQYYYPINENFNNNCNVWTDYTNEQIMMQNLSPVEPDNNNIAQNESYNYVYWNDQRFNGYPNTPSILTPVPENSMYSVPMTPTSPLIEMFSPPMYTSQPISPMIYAPPDNPTPEMIPSPIPLPMYSPPIQYMYPQTPTPNWYFHGINSQGFMFPPVNAQNVANRN